jgi:tRNA-Thr(GGU) m(6)t(6)A37 methyltransferase TsaA
MAIIYHPIGVIHTPFDDVAGMPIQPAGAKDVPGTAVIDPEFSEGLRDLDGFSHLILIYHFHRAGKAVLTVTPFLDNRRRGVFATRAPKRPNPIGLSIVRLLRVAENVLHLADVDVLDGTPLLDVKPYVSAFDHRAGTRAGWLEETDAERVAAKRADGRFR